MKTHFITIAKLLAGLALASGINSAQAVAVITLPTTGLDIPPQVYDQALVYSASLLSQQQARGLMPQNFTNFEFSTGTGTIPVIAYTGSNGISNPSPFASPMLAPNGNQATGFTGTWGLDAKGTIGALRTLLTIGGVNYEPLFVFDHNDGAAIGLIGSVSVYRGNTKIVGFNIDNNGNPVISCPKVDIGPTVTPTADGCNIQASTFNNVTYSWDTKGSGKPDYFGVFPTFDLYSSDFLATDSIVINMTLSGLTGGFEELGIAAYQFGSTSVPEPESIALFGLGLIGLAASRRRLSRKS